MRKNNKPHIRWMIRRDMPEVIEIEHAGFAIGQQWTEEDYILSLRKRNRIGIVAEVGDKVAGVAITNFIRRNWLLSDWLFLLIADGRVSVERWLKNSFRNCQHNAGREYLSTSERGTLRLNFSLAGMALWRFL